MAKKLLKNEDINTISLSLKGLPLENILTIRDKIQKESSDEVINKDLSTFLTSQIINFSDKQKEALILQKSLIDEEIQRLKDASNTDNTSRIIQLKNQLLYYKILINCITNQEEFNKEYDEDSNMDLYILETGKEPVFNGEFTESFMKFSEESARSKEINKIVNYAKKYIEKS